MPYNERGEIVNNIPEERVYPTTDYSYSGGNTLAHGNRNAFMTTTLIVSPITYSIVGLILNSVTNAGLDPFLAFILGALFGFLSTLIFNVTKGKYYDGQAKEYFSSLGIPLFVALIVVFGVVILIVIIVFYVLAGMASGGG